MHINNFHSFFLITNFTVSIHNGLLYGVKTLNYYFSILLYQTVTTYGVT